MILNHISKVSNVQEINMILYHINNIEKKLDNIFHLLVNYLMQNITYDLGIYKIFCMKLKTMNELP